MAEWGYKLLSDAQYIPLVVVGSISSTLSLVGSGCILFMSYRQRSKVLHRLLFALSLADMAQSSANLFMPYAIPSSIGLPGAVGNHVTCTAAGFFVMFGLQWGGCLNALISLYFYLSVVRSWREHDFTRRIRMEIATHVFVFLLAFGLNFFPAVYQMINPYEYINNLCILSSFPWNCGTEEGQLPCERSSQEELDKYTQAHFLVVVIFTIIAFACTCRVWYHVHSIRKRSASYTSFGSLPASSDNSIPASSHGTTLSNHKKSSSPAPDPILRQVCTQAILYFLVYFNTFIWPFIGQILVNSLLTAAEVQEKKTEPGWYALQFLFWTLNPLGGFFNFFVYTRLRVQQLRRLDPERSLYSVYREVIFSNYVSQRSSRRNSKNATTPLNEAPQQPTAAIHIHHVMEHSSSFASFAEAKEEEAGVQGDNYCGAAGSALAMPRLSTESHSNHHSANRPSCASFEAVQEEPNGEDGDTTTATPSTEGIHTNGNAVRQTRSDTFENEDGGTRVEAGEDGNKRGDNDDSQMPQPSDGAISKDLTDPSSIARLQNKEDGKEEERGDDVGLNSISETHVPSGEIPDNSHAANLPGISGFVAGENVQQHKERLEHASSGDNP
ncbi:expressed unknown protein [Seminavis robusta]|uniref:G-protein coupled receptors family 1 profile domain-containing protein n=1 Tax=Seminavis robusta TaxID=568900 RepID=A0A9N8EIE9_9STRA|nr:expressed unknown protein [Seminavis robusta]|eukprot:Sro1150_g246690.1 n/a (611) ;mRNA; f:28202-30160